MLKIKKLMYFKTFLLLICFSVTTIVAQDKKIDEKKSLSVSGFANYSQLKKYVKFVKKGKKKNKFEKVEEMQLNKKNPYVEYLDLLKPTKNTGNSEALYQFSINKDHKQSVTEAIRNGLGFMEPVYTIDFRMKDLSNFDNVKEMNSVIDYYLKPDKEASKALHEKLSKVFNLIDFEETWSLFTHKFEENATQTAKKFLIDYFEAKHKLTEELIQKKVKQAEGDLTGSFAEISAVSKDLFKDPSQKLKKEGKYRLHNTNYFNDFIAPLNKKTSKEIDFIISPSATIYKVFTKVVTEPKLQPHHNFKLYTEEFLLKKNYREKSEAYDKLLKKELNQEFKEYAIRNLKKDLETAIAKKRKLKSYTLTEEEAKKIEENAVLISKYIKEKDLANTFMAKKEKEFSINLAKEWVKSEKKFKKYLDLYKSAMISSNQFDILLANAMQEVKDGEIETATYPISSKLSMVKPYKNFIKLDRKFSGSSGVSRVLGSIGKKTSFGKNLLGQVNNLTAMFDKEISTIKTAKDAISFVKKRAIKLREEVNKNYFENKELIETTKQYTDVHLTLFSDAKKAFKLSIGEGSLSLDED
jgi:hypothetical protein